MVFPSGIGVGLGLLLAGTQSWRGFRVHRVSCYGGGQVRLLYSNNGGVDSCSLPLVRVCLELGRRMFLGDAISVVYLLAKGDGSNLLPRELFLLRWRLCRRHQTPVPVTGVFIGDGGSLAALPQPRR